LFGIKRGGDYGNVDYNGFELPLPTIGDSTGFLPSAIRGTTTVFTTENSDAVV
jgi:hypothetical protein